MTESAIPLTMETSRPETREEARQVQQLAARRRPQHVRGYDARPAAGGHEDDYGCESE